uniref:Uncharacterized protein n=1 Tax=Daphnia magna TaxID=35525 RepID=A0A0P5W3N3_9CRUS
MPMPEFHVHFLRMAADERKEGKQIDITELHLLIIVRPCLRFHTISNAKIYHTA